MGPYNALLVAQPKAPASVTETQQQHTFSPLRNLSSFTPGSYKYPIIVSP